MTPWSDPLSTEFLPPPTRAILGPLTTTFSHPSSCTSLFQPLFGQFPVVEDESDDQHGTMALQGVKCSTSVLPPYLGESGYTTAFLKNDINCWPSVTLSVFTDEDALDLQGKGLYSPGLWCPSGYSMACSTLGGNATPTTIEGARNFTFLYSLLPEETAAGCCPSGFDCFMTSSWSTPYQYCLSMAFEGAMTTNQCLDLAGNPSISTTTFDAPLSWTATETWSETVSDTTIGSLDGWGATLNSTLMDLTPTQVPCFRSCTIATTELESFRLAPLDRPADQLALSEQNSEQNNERRNSYWGHYSHNTASISGLHHLRASPPKTAKIT
ncbi:hypothetical protein EV356DRAFT_513810 [Viridothelium virens]|uniref:Uncharacterized protein n=1 Tax=Viridothelium virens TaxID=1048519 RepID=A0A6A6HN78_VIRVR|nr:hypothetical protein EV356DRAFT_513810 [Viridothelium virens]